MFKANSCGSCHVFAAAGATGTVGPSLDAKRLKPAYVRQVVRSGRPGMPGYADRIGAHDLELLARYVVTRSRAR